jgi:hypothetical protein
MKIIVIKNLYPKINNFNEMISYVQNISLTNSHWIQHDKLMHLSINN